MKTGLELAYRVDDLKFIVLNNMTDVEFVTSDHPSVISNRFSFDRLNQREFGIASSGSFMALPLTPRYLAFFYDMGVYTISIPRGTSVVDLKIAGDIPALNELQHLNAQQNIYFSSWADRGSFAYQNAKLDKQRALKPKIQTLVRDHSLPGQTFRIGTADEEASSSQRVIGASTQHPRPSHWPSFLKIRSKPKTFSNGSAAGHVRKEEWLRG
jgi:hypothetical protein